MMARPNPEGVARLGQVVPKKVCRQATGRNYMKRVCRELFRRLESRFLGLDVVIQHRKKFGRDVYPEISDEFEALSQSIQKCRVSSSSSSVATS